MGLSGKMATACFDALGDVVWVSRPRSLCFEACIASLAGQEQRQRHLMLAACSDTEPDLDSAYTYSASCSSSDATSDSSWPRALSCTAIG